MYSCINKEIDCEIPTMEFFGHFLAENVHNVLSKTAIIIYFILLMNSTIFNYTIGLISK